jgi:predicted ATP-dependent endonuclease of OLD family
MSMSWIDYMYDQVMSDSHDEAVYKAMMKNAALSQCIYVFVEGDSEAVAFPIILEQCGIDLEEFGIVIANYNGVGNLWHTLRLLNNTLSHDRPIVITYDDDIAGKEKIQELTTNPKSAKMLNSPLVTMFPVPSNSVVTYSNDETGGSFEEIFASDYFISSCFKEGIMDASLIQKETSFRNDFKCNSPWLSQINKFGIVN